jgi:hypothetical protein
MSAYKIGAMVTPAEATELLAYLANPIRATREALDDGASWADTITNNLPRNQHFWSNAARYKALHYLSQIETEEWRLGRRLRNCGIEIVRGLQIVRLLHAQDGQPPHPGHSGARREYWQQASLGLRATEDGVQGPAAANLLLDWEIDAKRELTLALSKPFGVWRYRGIPKLEWRLYVTFDDDGGLGFRPTEDGGFDLFKRLDPTEDIGEEEAG